MRSPLLDARAVGKHFGGVTALREVSLTIAQGEIYGLIGPNGAGKTTLFNCITGFYKPTDGTMRLASAGGEIALERLNDFRISKLAKVARTFQNLQIFFNMSALENVMVGRHLRERAGWLAAVLTAQARVSRGLEIGCPVLVGHAAMSGPDRPDNPALDQQDTVLDVRAISRLAPGLGRDVTVRSFPGAVHDLALSAQEPRTAYLAAMARFLDERVRR